MTTPFLGEFAGTLMLVLLGDGVVATVLLKRSKGEASGWMVITAGWAFAVMAGVFASTACGSKDAFLNPAGHSERGSQPDQRNHRHLRPGFHRRRDLFQSCERNRSRTRPIPRRMP